MRHMLNVMSNKYAESSRYECKVFFKFKNGESLLRSLFESLHPDNAETGTRLILLEEMYDAEKGEYIIEFASTESIDKCVDTIKNTVDEILGLVKSVENLTDRILREKRMFK